jgi:hypothetical protein
MKMVGEQLRDSNLPNKKRIHSILSNPIITSELSRSLFSWNLFDWISSEGLMEVSSINGIYAEPLKISRRSFLENGKNDPWSLIFEKVDIGISSKRPVIPAGMAITNNRSQLIGYISLGFDIDKLKRNIKESLMDPNVEYILLNEELDPVFGSKKRYNYHKNQSQNNDSIQKQLQDKSEKSFLENSITIHDSEYYYLKKIEGYPFYILTGYKISYLRNKVYSSLVPTIMSVILITTISIISLFTLHRKVQSFSNGITNYIKFIKGKTATRKKFLRSFYLTEFYYFIKELREMISQIQRLKKENKIIKESKSQYKKSIEEVMRINNTLNNFNLDKAKSNELKSLNINRLLKRVTNYFYLYLSEHKIEITYSSNKRTPNFITNEEIFIIALLSLMSHIIKFTTTQAKINIDITTHTFTDHSPAMITMLITDNSIMNATYSEILSEKVFYKTELSSDGFYMTPVKKIIEYFELLGCGISIVSKSQVGNSIKVDIPHSINKDKESIVKNNILKFIPETD